MRTPELRQKIAELGLTDKQKVFCEEYVKDFNVGRAFMAAGYSGGRYTRLTEDDGVKKYIEILKNEALERVHLDPDRVLKERMSIAFSRIGDFTEFVEKKDDEGKVIGRVVRVKDLKEMTDEQMACIQEISETENGIKIKLHSKNDSLTSLEKFVKSESNDTKPAGIKVGKLNVLILAEKEHREAADKLLDASMRMSSKLHDRVNQLVEGN